MLYINIYREYVFEQTLQTLLCFFISLHNKTRWSDFILGLCSVV